MLNEDEGINKNGSRLDRVLERLLENEGGDNPKRNSWGTEQKEKG